MRVRLFGQAVDPGAPTGENLDICPYRQTPKQDHTGVLTPLLKWGRIVSFTKDLEGIVG